MLHFGVIGEHLGHSLSKPIHEGLWRKLGIEAEYTVHELPRETFREDAEKLIASLDGFNITIPYKRDIMACLNGLNDLAARVGAVNTVRCADRMGYNTDVAGFTEMLVHHGIDPMGKPCYVLGTGGASVACVAALENMGASGVTRVSRRAGDQPGIIDYDTLGECFTGGVLVNTTPAGMWPDVNGCPLSPALLDRLLPLADGVADIIYNPAETVLTAAAKAKGIPACTGLYMLIAQAVEAERIWLNMDIPAGMTAELMKELKLL